MTFKLHLFLYLTFILLNISCERSVEPNISIHYLGHSSFILQFDNEVTVLTDFGTSKSYGLDSPIYGFGEFVPDVVTYSHVDHIDHYGRKILDSVLNVLTNCDSLKIKDLKIKPIRTSEIDIKKADNTSFCFVYKGVNILHLGDAQDNIKNIFSEDHRRHLKKIFPQQIDLLLMTIEGRTQFLKEAEAFINLLHPKAVIPMHYWSKAYKENFLDFIRDREIYQIREILGAKFSFSNLDEDNEKITIISLEPAPYAK